MKVHKKLVYARELEFWKKLEKTDLVPLVISVEKIGKFEYILTTKRYPMTLGFYMEFHPSDQTYLERLPALISKLHKRGVLHGDLHLCNIVIDPKSKDMRLIDFGGSGWISELGYESLKENEFFWGHEFDTPISMLEYERELIYYEDMSDEMKKYHPKSKNVKVKKQEFAFINDLPHGIPKRPTIILFD